MEDRQHTIIVDGERMSVADAIRMCPVLGEQAVAETVEIVDESLDRQERAANDSSYNEEEEYRRQMADLKASFSVDNLKSAHAEPQAKTATETHSSRQTDKQPRPKTTNKTAASSESRNPGKTGSAASEEGHAERAASATDNTAAESIDRTAASTTSKVEATMHEKVSAEHRKPRETPAEALLAEIARTAAARQETEQEKTADIELPTSKPHVAKAAKPAPRNTPHHDTARKPVAAAEAITLPAVNTETPEPIMHEPVVGTEAEIAVGIEPVATVGTPETTDDMPQLEAVPMSADELLEEFPELADMFGIPEETEYITAEVAEDEFLSDEDLQILAAFQAQLETAAPEDFMEANDTPLLTVEAHPAELFSAPPVELQPPAEASPAAIIMVEQITEQIATLEPEASTKAESILDEIGHTLKVLERTMPATTETNTDAEEALSAEQIETAKAELVRQVQKLCETIGLEYSEDEVSELIAQLLIQPELTRELANIHSEGAETLMTVDKGTHESLPWFTAFIKHLKYFAQRAAWRYRLLGRRALHPLMAPSLTA